MNPALKSQFDAAAQGHADLVGVGGFYQIAGGGAPLPLLRIAVQELGDAVTQEKYGEDLSRVIQATIRQALIPGIEPSQGDSLTITDGPQAGTWSILGVDARTAVAVTVAARLATRATASAPGARVIKR